MVNAQEWLDKKIKREITSLEFKNQNLSGDLDLRDFVNLEELVCSENQLTSLNLNNCENLRRLHCSANCLTKLSLSQNNKLEYLHCSKNQLNDPELPNEKRNLKQLIIHDNKLKQDLYFVKDFINLEEMCGGGEFFLWLSRTS